MIKMTLAARFESRVDRSAGPNLCHLWRGTLGGSGMPCLSVSRGGRKTSTSPRRVAWELSFGPVPDHHLVMVTCQTKLCVNFRHLHLRSLDPVNVFWQSVEKAESGCWMWTGETGARGYGMFEKGTVRMQAHRYSYEMHVAPIPKDDGEWCVCHHCDVPKCVNPEHLFLGRDADNLKDMVAKGRAGWQKARARRAATESPSNPESEK